jgi:hypothetical protein
MIQMYNIDHRESIIPFTGYDKVVDFVQKDTQYLNGKYDRDVLANEIICNESTDEFVYVPLDKD